MLALVPDVLRRVVLPARLDAPESFLRDVERLRSNLRDAGVPSRSALVALLTVDGENATQDPSHVEGEIRQGVASGDHEQVVDAVRAAYYWAHASSQGEAPAPNPDLLAEVAGLVLSPHRRVLAEILYWLNRTVEHAPDVLPPPAVARLCTGLDILLSETGLPSLRERLSIRTNEDRVALLRRPEARALAAELAIRLGRQYELEPCERTEAAWRAAIGSDPFPDVRAASARVG